MKKIILYVVIVSLLIGLGSCDLPNQVTCEDGYLEQDGICVVDPATCSLPETLIDGKCEETHLLIPDLIGMSSGDLLRWSFDHDITVEKSYGVSDLVEPNQVYFQSISNGEYVEKGSTIEVSISNGYVPDVPITLPLFDNYTKSSLEDWLVYNKIRNYKFYYTFNLDINRGYFVDIEVEKDGEHEGYIRNDQFNFFLSKGPIEIDTLDFSDQSKVRGVNLGGWFVLESWMTPNLFGNVAGNDETRFMQQKPNAAEVLENHWDTFITESDFEYLANYGVEYIRLPVPWWMYGGSAFIGEPNEVAYAPSEFYVRRAMEWAEKYNINVLIDLHTAPGCQNGFDNGGIQGVLEWGKNEANTGYVAKTTEVLVQMTSDFSEYESFWGIQLLNEPGHSVSMSTLLKFYRDTYQQIREINNDVWVGMHDGFRAYDTTTWKAFFSQNQFEKVFFDIHLYHVFDDGLQSKDILDHLNHVKYNNASYIRNYDGVVPVIIGEWSHALPGDALNGLSPLDTQIAKIAFGYRQINVYTQNMGFFFWSYKIDRPGYDEWDFKKSIGKGWMPSSFKTN